MTAIKCKMCGGNTDINESKSIAICQYCGSTMTLPKLDSEKRINLHNPYERLTYEYISELDRYFLDYSQIESYNYATGTRRTLYIQKDHGEAYYYGIVGPRIFVDGDFIYFKYKETDNTFSIHRVFIKNRGH